MKPIKFLQGAVGSHDEAVVIVPKRDCHVTIQLPRGQKITLHFSPGSCDDGIDAPLWINFPEGQQWPIRCCNLVGEDYEDVTSELPVHAVVVDLPDGTFRLTRQECIDSGKHNPKEREGCEFCRYYT